MEAPLDGDDVDYGHVHRRAGYVLLLKRVRLRRSRLPVLPRRERLYDGSRRRSRLPPFPGWAGGDGQQLLRGHVSELVDESRDPDPHADPGPPDLARGDKPPDLPQGTRVLAR